VFTNRGRAIPRLSGGDYISLRDEGGLFESTAIYYGGEMGVQAANRAEFVATMLVGPAWRASRVDPLVALRNE
jgi:hypothetical protein